MLDLRMVLVNDRVNRVNRGKNKKEERKRSKDADNRWSSAWLRWLSLEAEIKPVSIEIKAVLSSIYAAHLQTLVHITNTRVSVCLEKGKTDETLKIDFWEKTDPAEQFKAHGTLLGSRQMNERCFCSDTALSSVCFNKDVNMIVMK